MPVDLLEELGNKKTLHSIDKISWIWNPIEINMLQRTKLSITWCLIGIFIILVASEALKNLEWKPYFNKSFQKQKSIKPHRYIARHTPNKA